MLADPGVPDTMELAAPPAKKWQAARPELVPRAPSPLSESRCRALLLVAEAAVACALAVAIGGVSPGVLLVATAVLGQLVVDRQRPLPLRLAARADVGTFFTMAALGTALVAVARLFLAMPTQVWFVPAGAAMAAAACRAAGYAVTRWARRTGRLNESAVVLGNPATVSEIWQVIARHPECGLVAATPQPDVLGTAQHIAANATDLERQLTSGAIRRVILAPTSMSDPSVATMLGAAMRHACATYVMLPPALRSATPPFHDQIGDVLLQRIPSRHRTTLLLKRPFDVAASFVLLVLLAPLAIAVALAVRLSSRGPILYRQKRLAQQGRVIDVLKFRTFPADEAAREEEQWIEEAGGWTVRGVESPIAFGRWLRRTSLDELPQLWNVLRGEMSLIGPRPERPELADTLAGFIDGYADRHRFPMGLTGLAQVNGLWGPTSIELRVVFDNYYIEHWSLLQDFSILLRTIPEVLRRACTG